jgi:hypothetical protein
MREARKWLHAADAWVGVGLVMLSRVEVGWNSGRGLEMDRQLRRRGMAVIRRRKRQY